MKRSRRQHQRELRRDAPEYGRKPLLEQREHLLAGNVAARDERRVRVAALVLRSVPESDRRPTFALMKADNALRLVRTVTFTPLVLESQIAGKAPVELAERPRQTVLIPSCSRVRRPQVVPGSAPASEVVDISLSHASPFSLPESRSHRAPGNQQSCTHHACEPSHCATSTYDPRR